MWKCDLNLTKDSNWTDSPLFHEFCCPGLFQVLRHLHHKKIQQENINAPPILTYQSTTYTDIPKHHLYWPTKAPPYTNLRKHHLYWPTKHHPYQPTKTPPIPTYTKAPPILIYLRTHNYSNLPKHHLYRVTYEPSYQTIRRPTYCTGHIYTNLPISTHLSTYLPTHIHEPIYPFSYTHTPIKHPELTNLSS